MFSLKKIARKGLTHWYLKKMANILQTIFSNECSWQENVFDLNFVKFIAKGPIRNKSALV